MQSFAAMPPVVDDRLSLDSDRQRRGIPVIASRFGTRHITWERPDPNARRIIPGDRNCAVQNEKTPHWLKSIARLLYYMVAGDGITADTGDFQDTIVRRAFSN